MEQNRTEPAPQVMRQTKLPILLGARTVEDMMLGERRAVQVHAMVVDTEYDMWLRSGFKTYAKWSADHPLLITLVEGGFEVDATQVEDDGWFANTDRADFDENEGGRLLKVLGITFKLVD